MTKLRFGSKEDMFVVVDRSGIWYAPVTGKYY